MSMLVPSDHLERVGRLLQLVLANDAPDRFRDFHPFRGPPPTHVDCQLGPDGALDACGQSPETDQSRLGRPGVREAGPKVAEPCTGAVAPRADSDACRRGAW